MQPEYMFPALGICAFVIGGSALGIGWLSGRRGMIHPEDAPTVAEVEAVRRGRDYYCAEYSRVAARAVYDGATISELRATVEKQARDLEAMPVRGARGRFVKVSV